MKNKSYLEQIDWKIDQCRKELDRLTIARGVVAEIAASSKPDETPQEKSAPAPAAAPGSITVRRAAPPQPAPNKEQAVERKRIDPAVKQRMREDILADLKANPQTSSTLIEKYKPGGSKNEKQMIYDALYNLKLQGFVQRADDGLYSLATNH